MYWYDGQRKVDILYKAEEGMDTLKFSGHTD